MRPITHEVLFRAHIKYPGCAQAVFAILAFDYHGHSRQHDAIHSCRQSHPQKVQSALYSHDLLQVFPEPLDRRFHSETVRIKRNEVPEKILDPAGAHTRLSGRPWKKVRDLRLQQKHRGGNLLASNTHLTSEGAGP